MRVFRRRHDLACREAVALVTAYLDEALSPTDRARFETHLAACPHCSTYLDQIRATIALTGRVEPDVLDPQAQDELIALYRSWRAG
jgi:anti-sigma factor RsiW